MKIYHAKYLKAVAQLDHLDISNRVYQLGPDGLEEDF
jgi:hypothetical protein